MGEPNINSDLTPARVRAQLIENNVLRLRKAGWTYDQIGSMLGMAPELCARAFRKACKRLRTELKEEAREIVQLNLARLDEMMLKAMESNEVANVLKIMDMQAKLLGLYAPAKVISMDEPAAKRDLTKLSLAELDALEALEAKASGEAGEADEGEIEYPATVKVGKEE